MSQNNPELDPLGSLLPLPTIDDDPEEDTPINTRTRMASIEPTSNPVGQDTAVPEVSTSAAAPTTPAPVPTTAAPPTSSAVPTTSSPATTASPPPVTSSEAPEEPSSSSVLPSSSSVAPTSSATPTSTSTSTTETSTSSSTSTAASSSSTSSSSSSSPPIATITSTVSQERPGLVTSFSSVSRSSTVSGAAASSTGKGGVGGSGLPLGGLVGIIIGGIIALCLIALIVTRTIRKKARNRRTAHRTSMFEPWPAPVTMEDEDDLEKSRFPPPSQSYPMSNTGPGTYDYETYDPYGQAGVGAGAGAVAGAAAATYPPNNAQYSDQDYDYSGSGQGHGQAPYDAAGAGTASAAAAAMGLRDGMMVMVSVGFVRSLEDELAVNPGQQLWLHTAYDDGWTLCEDQNQNRGVVPLTCIEPWTDDPNHLSAMPRSHTAESLSATSQRRSSLYQDAQAGAAYLDAPAPGR